MANEMVNASVPGFCDYGAEVTMERLERLLSHSEGVKASDGIEPVHQMRVWSRRSRAAAATFSLCFPRKAFGEIEKELKAVAGALGEARDLDVMIENLTLQAEALPLEQQAGVRSFIAHLKAERERLQKPVIKAVMRLEKRGLIRRLETLRQRENASG